MARKSKDYWEERNTQMMLRYEKMTEQTINNLVKAYNKAQEDIEKEIINLIKDNQNITIEECAEMIDKSVRTTKELFKKLKEKNIIKRVGSKKTGCWEVKQ